MSVVSNAGASGEPSIVRKQFRVHGIVQGVGFRPFVYHLAHALGLRGFVLNTSVGVVIEVEGAGTALDCFLTSLTNNPPPLAEIDSVTVAELAPTGVEDFVISGSLEDQGPMAAVPADVATCPDCERDFTDPANRRFQYPFTNCTQCGPRYSIIQEVPYDRPATTMARFIMCAACQAEYDDPASRRFHAQPNACPECGPRLELVEADSGHETQLGTGVEMPDTSVKTLKMVRGQLREGKILAIKGLGGFHLACNAENDAAVRRLRERKRRSDKPFALMARDLNAVEKICWISDADRQALSSTRRPIVILPRRPGAGISAVVAPNQPTLGVMLPYTPLHHLLFGDAPGGSAEFTALVMTSGNLSEEPMAPGNSEAETKLHDLADSFLFHDRDIHTRVDDSIVRIFEGRERVLRRARGFAPHAIDLGVPMAEVLGCGGELKNTLCLTRGRCAILSQHLGDMENYETLEFFEETLEKLKRLFRMEPRAVAHDLHPQYMSTKFGLELPGVERIGVQHHHAHIASCMAENHLSQRVIGVAMDGTGYGTDGRIWGGEFLVGDLGGFERRAHFRYVPLAGGDAAVRQPWRSALSHLEDALGPHSLPDSLAIWEIIPAKTIAGVQTMMRRGINTVQTSSCGRLFDAVASIVGLRHETNYEGQAAMELEAAAAEGIDASFPFEIGSADPWAIDLRPMIEGIVGGQRRGTQIGELAARFHNTLAEIVAEVCQRIRRREKLQQVCLSGGCFQNMKLLAGAVSRLRRRGFEVFLHAQVPPNDGGISLGQAVIASEALRRGGHHVPGYSR
ncbi:MAG TPA: carbamoyltransferase HypF [Terriglobia bacterium]|nr:carbamoyltransferase HypF [Terriglobia bacterium]